MAISSNTQVGEVVKLNFKTAPLFQANNIDYCCGGGKTITEACNDAGIEADQLINKLVEIAQQVDPDTEYINNLKLAELCNFIIKRHHSYVRDSISFLNTSLDKICEVHGTNHPELFEIKKLFNESGGELTMHMQKEEIMLFPYIQRMEKAYHESSPMGGSPFGLVSNPIKTMISEHETEGKRFDRIAELSQNYSIPKDACTTYKVTLNHLKDFENDLHRHIHLENNILFPKAIKLETELAKLQN